MKIIIERHQMIRKYFLSSAILLSMLACTNLARAVSLPRALATDQHIKTVVYNQNDVVPITTTMLNTTQIIFAKNERIENIQNGDAVAWGHVVQNGLANMLFIKPTISGSDTNMIVLTNRRTYYFHLTSYPKSPEHLKHNTYAIRFTYPDSSLISQSSKKINHHVSRVVKRHYQSKRDPRDYNWDYSYSGSSVIVPAHVFDDGKFTYMQLAKGVPIPAIFVVDTRSGRESIVNFRREKNYLVIHRLAPQFTLRAGKELVASVFNNRRIARLKHRGEHHVA